MKLYLQSGGNLFYGQVASLTKARLALAAEASSSKPKSDDGLISEKLILKLQETGIPVDVDNFMYQLAELEDDIDHGFGVSKRAVYQLQAQANRIIQQAEYLKLAEKLAEKNESFGEVAVGGRGELFVITNKGDIKAVSASEYDLEKHGPALTVAELIQQRKFSSAQAGDIHLTKVINDNIGMSKINEYIQSIVATVGSSENTNEAYIDLAGYIGKEAAKKPTGELLIALLRMNEIMKLLGPDAIFKIKDTAQGKNLEAAFLYIQQVLPRDMKTQLVGRNVAAGNNYESGGKYIQSLIAGALNSANITKDDHYISYEASPNNNAGTAKNKLQRNLGVLELLVLGSLGKIDYKLMNSKNPEYSLNLHGNGIGRMADFDNNIVDKSPLSVVLQKGLAPLVDELHITIGNQKIPPGMLDTILYNGGAVVNVWAPVNENGDVDLEQLALLSEVLSVCDTNPQLTTEDKNALLKKYNLPGTFDEKGVFHGSGDMAQFLVMTGVASDEIIDSDENPFADKIPDRDKEYEFNLIERIYGLLNKGIKGDGKYKFEKGWFNATTDLYRAPIFMRLSRTAQIDAGTFSNKGPLVSTPTYQEQLAYDLVQNRKLVLLTTPSTQALYE